MNPFPGQDLDEILLRGEHDVRCWSGSRILVSGGTGFVGRWLVSALLQAEDRWGLGLRLVLLTRDARRAPVHPAVTVVESDARTVPPLPHVDAAIAGAASSAAQPGSEDARAASLAGTIVADTVKAIEAAAGGRLLLLSSGAVYGRSPGPVKESDLSAPDPIEPHTVYGQAKRLAESLCAAAAADGQLETISARIFTLVGPGLPLDAHFAAGNVLRDVLRRQPILLKGDGSAVRSYLYSADLVVWLWRLLARGRSGTAYNVGSPDAISVRQLAETAAGLVDPPMPVVVQGLPGLSNCYVPDVSRAQHELALSAWTGTEDGLRRTLRFAETIASGRSL